ncbi:uncharacterized protein LOC111613254 [Centruroides sculpturatus]|uniref:uncharacterized protein LOC111613254 n=1 Tax=Centruroides sculpturatus TaxID=218467 RepID=UPI000C6ECDBC|nr:uncharacterized protein LOC111613254 [Centruroides sculpturatus]
MFTSLLISAFALFVMIKVRYKKTGKHCQFSFRNIIWCLFSTLSNQESATLNKVRHFPHRLTVGSWLLAAFVLLSSFSSCLVSFLTASEKPWIPKTFHELASAVRSGEYECGVLSNVAARTFIMTAKTEDLLILKEHMTLNNNYFELTEEPDVIERVRNRKFAIISSDFYLIPLKNKLRRNVFISDDALLSFNCAYSMRKGFYYRREVNEILSNWIAAGITQKRYGNEYNIGKEITSREIKPLKLNEVGGAFILLIIGYILSFTSFLSELLIAKIIKRIRHAPMP